jgi:hypothetical protein
LDAGSGVVQARGWAKFCALKSKGWISMNCQDIGSCASGGFAYKVVYSHTTRVFRTGAVSPPLNTSSLAWSGYNDNTGVGYLSFEWANLTGTEVCGNGADDDFNGLVDVADPACATEGAAFGNCSDGVDNEGLPIFDSNVSIAIPSMGKVGEWGQNLIFRSISRSI